MGVVAAYAGEGCGAKAKAAGAKDAKVKACCAAKAKAAASVTLSDEEGKEESAHVCPDVSGRVALKNFHHAMHPMHMALGESDFDGLREKLPALVEATKAVGEYKCDGYEKCSEPCRKDFDGRKAELLESVDKLEEACKGKDNEIVTASFDVMHEAYITFANTCVHPEEEKAEETPPDNQ
jgi:hypothetical protein